jgi:hypothetical protein
MNMSCTYLRIHSFKSIKNQDIKQLIIKNRQCEVIKLENIQMREGKEWTQIQGNRAGGNGFVVRQPTVVETSMNENDY